MSERNDHYLNFVNLSIQLISAIFVAASVVFLAIQTNAQTDSLRVTAYTAVMDKQMEINKIFIENPHIYPYFFDGEKINAQTNCTPEEKKSQAETEVDCFQQAQIIADYHIDFFDLFLTHRNSIIEKDQTDAYDTCKAWERYIVDRLQSSPILCQRLAEVGNTPQNDPPGKGWYTLAFTAQLNDVCNKKTTEFSDWFSCNHYPQTNSPTNPQIRDPKK